MIDFTGKTALVFGVANERSIAWSIAKYLSQGNAQVGFSYASDALERRVRPLAESLHSKLIEKCDVSSEEDISKFFNKVKSIYPTIDILIHSIAFAPKDDLENRFVNTTRAGFHTAMEISAYSLITLSRHALPLMAHGGSITTLSYYGAEKVIPNYNIMGPAKAALEAIVRYLAYDLGQEKIRVNAISAGPLKTLASAGIKNFRDMLDNSPNKTPLRENIHTMDVAHLAGFLSSDLAPHITGTTMYVDSGAHIMGL
jgi:enoyl-[acyl-carrier protein] reductase I